MKTRTVTDYEYDPFGRLKRTVATEIVIFPGDDDGEKSSFERTTQFDFEDDDEPVLARARRLAPTHPVFRTAGRIDKPNPRSYTMNVADLRADNVLDQTPDNVIQLDEYR